MAMGETCTSKSASTGQPAGCSGSWSPAFPRAWGWVRPTIFRSPRRATAPERRAKIYATMSPARGQASQASRAQDRGGEGGHVQAGRREIHRSAPRGLAKCKHAGQWSSTLATFAYPIIGDLPIQAIDTPLVLKILEPIWNVKNETAGRLRGRVESMLDVRRFANTGSGKIPRDGGAISTISCLPPPKSSADAHHAAMPYRDLPHSWRPCAHGTA